MILVWIIIIMIVAALLSWLAGQWSNLLPRWISLIALVINLAWVLSVWIYHAGEISLFTNANRLVDFNREWIPQLGINFHLAMDGLSFVMLLLSFFIGILSVLVSWKHISLRPGFFYFNVMLVLTGMVGIFLASDLFLFYFSWEIMLVPMYFILSIWGYNQRLQASYKFFLFTQGSSLLMFLSILGLYFIHGYNTGDYTFDYEELLDTFIDTPVAIWLMLGFLIAFVVKLPLVPFHTWLPEATTEAPATGSIILAGLLWNTGAYGILRFVLPLFPEACRLFAPDALILGVASILYAAKLAFAQTDLKRLIVYTSISSIGFLMVGIFSFNAIAMQGVIVQLITHTISTTALLILAGTIHERANTRNINQMGGFWTSAPVLGGIGMVFTMDTLALPGLGNFVAEFLILVGAFQSNMFFAVLTSLGMVTSCIYSLRILRKVFFGKKQASINIRDFNVKERIVMGSLVVLSFFLGLYPQTIFKTTNSSIRKILPGADTKTVETGSEKKITETDTSFVTLPVKQGLETPSAKRYGKEVNFERQ